MDKKIHINMEENLANKRMFTPSNVVFIVGLSIHLVVSYFILDSKIEKYALNREADKQIINLRLDRLEDQDKIHNLAIETLVKIQGNMIREEEPKIKNYKQ